MMNFLDGGELFERGELSPDITNVTGVCALRVHVNSTFNPDSNVCSN